MIRTRLLSLLSLFAPLLLSACMSPPTGLDLSMQKTSANGRYVAAVKPASNPIVINKIHAWELQLTLPSGQPVTGASILVDGGMPQHGHGLPTKPRVTRELGDGRYLIEGVKFSMTGWWELKLKIDAAQGPDKVTFNLVLP